MMQFYGVEVPLNGPISPAARYITVDAAGKISAWSERPERNHICWYTEDVGTYLGHTDDTEQWSTHWYFKFLGEWWYEPIEPHGRIDGFHWDVAPQYAEGHNALHTPPLRGRKDDAAKLRYDLLPPHALEQLAAVLTYGAEKYGPHNWRHVADAKDRYYAAALRHLQAWRQGEQLDPESGLPHLAHAVCSLTFLLEQNDDAS